MKISFVAAIAAAVTAPGAPPPGTHMHYEIRIDKSDAENYKNIPGAVVTSGTITLYGTKVTCKQMNDFFEQMAKKSKSKLTPPQCLEYPLVAPKKSN
jgi:hypothetical protein